jgi:hypothetical protein
MFNIYNQFSLLQVYDRLRLLGICLTYDTTTTLLDNLKGDYNKLIVEAVKAGKKIRFVGDNVNFKVGVRDERSGHHGKLMHYFGSAVLIYGKMHHFDHLPDSQPQMGHNTLMAADILPSTHEVELLVEDSVFMFMKVATKHILYFQCLSDKIPKICWTNTAPN